MKECPPIREHPPPTYFWPNFLCRVKFTWMSAHPGASLRSTASSTMHWGKKLCVVLYYRDLCIVLYYRDLCIDGHVNLNHAHGHMVPFRVLCVVRTWLWSCWWCRCMLLLVQLFALRASSHFEHDKGAPWLNEETLKRAPTPLFGRLVYDAPPMGTLLWDYSICFCQILIMLVS